MIPAVLAGLPWRLIGIAAIAAAVGFGLFKVYDAGRDSVQAKWDADIAARNLAFDKAAANTARIEEKRDQLKWRIEHELQPKLAAADSHARDLARRLHDYHTSSCTLPEAARTAAQPAGAGGVGSKAGSVDDLVGDFIAACKRDAIRLNGWREWWDQVDKPPEPIK